MSIPEIVWLFNVMRGWVAVDVSLSETIGNLPEFPAIPGGCLYAYISLVCHFWDKCRDILCSEREKERAREQEEKTKVKFQDVKMKLVTTEEGKTKLQDEDGTPKEGTPQDGKTKLERPKVGKTKLEPPKRERSKAAR